MITPSTRRQFIHATAGILAAGMLRPLFAADPLAAPKTPAAFFAGPIQTQKLEDGLYVLLGAGGNTTVIFDAGHLLVIDAGIPQRGKDLFDAAVKLAPDAKAKTLVNTHWHFDHVGGNNHFAAAGFAVVGTASCRKRLGEKITLEDMGMTADPIPESDRPTLTFEKELKLYAPVEVQITRIAPSHTDTDAIAFIEKQNTLITGDLLFSGGFPVIDRSTGGSLDGMIAATKQLLAIGDEKTRVVPGHGPVGTKAALKEQLELLNMVRERLAPLGEKKMTMEQVLTAGPLADLDDKWGRGFLRSPVFTRMAYGQWLTK